MNKVTLVLLCGLSFMGSAIAQTAVCPGGIPSTASNDAFELLEEGEVLHIASNLIFMRCSIGQTWDGAECIGDPEPYTWQKALSTAQSTTYLDNNSWRLPNLKELSVIIESACVRPSINETVFPNTAPDDYWTSTPSLLNEQSAWAITFTNGSNAVKLRSRSLYIRLVRNNISG